MSVELLLFLFAFAVPGSLAVLTWDWGIHKKDRPLPQLLGYGIIVSLFSYALLESCTYLDVRRLLDDNGALSLIRMLEKGNIVLFCLLCLGEMVAGWLVSWFVRTFVFPRLQKSPYETIWGQVFTETVAAEQKTPWIVRFANKAWQQSLEKLRTAAPRVWRVASWPFSLVSRLIAWIRRMLSAPEPERASFVQVRTKDGLSYLGQIHRVPVEPRPGDFLALSGVEFKGKDDDAPWGPVRWPVTLLRFDDIDRIFIYPGVTNEQDEQGPGVGAAHRLEPPDLEETRGDTREPARQQGDGAPSTAGAHTSSEERVVVMAAETTDRTSH